MANPIGSSWGKTPVVLGDTGGVVTWSFGPPGVSIVVFSDVDGLSVSGDSFLNFNFASVIRNAFGAWSRYGNIEFMQVEDGGGAAGAGKVADIRIFFGAIPGNIIGRAFFPTFSPTDVAGDILLDKMSSFNFKRSLFKGLVLHEIGHALGLDHVETQSIMTPRIRYDALQQDDINGIQLVYGPQDNRQPTYNLPAGQRKLDILDAPAKIIVSGNAGDNVIDGSKTAEHFRGRIGNDLLFGRKGDDRLEGQSGRDTLRGGSGDDTLKGGSQNDSLKGGEGRDRLLGQDNNDDLRAGKGKDYLNGGSGEDILRGKPGDDTLRGGDQADTLLGGHGSDTLEGGRGGDKTAGGLNDDRVSGGAGHDTLHGNRGNDTLRGGGQDDLIEGGLGNDTINGGTGRDVFVFKGQHGADVIRDFDARDRQDKIDLRGVASIADLHDLTGPRGAARKSGDDVLIDTGGGNSILLENVRLADLGGADFIF